MLRALMNFFLWVWRGQTNKFLRLPNSFFLLGNIKWHILHLFTFFMLQGHSLRRTINSSTVKWGWNDVVFFLLRFFPLKAIFILMIKCLHKLRVSFNHLELSYTGCTWPFAFLGNFTLGTQFVYVYFICPNSSKCVALDI